MAQDLSTRIASRADALANWTAQNPVLLQGEIAVVFDGQNQLFKVGDGHSAFNDLPFSFYGQFASELVNASTLRAKNLAQGYGSQLSGVGGVATGYKSQVSANFAQAHGRGAVTSSDFSYTWNGAALSGYMDKGPGTYCINPESGISGLYVGVRSLAEIIADEAVPDLSGVDELDADRASTYDIAVAFNQLLTTLKNRKQES